MNMCNELTEHSVRNMSEILVSLKAPICIYKLLVEIVSLGELVSACIGFLRTFFWQRESYFIYLNLDLHFLVE